MCAGKADGKSKAKNSKKQGDKPSDKNKEKNKEPAKSKDKRPFTIPKNSQPTEDDSEDEDLGWTFANSSSNVEQFSGKATREVASMLNSAKLLSESSIYGRTVSGFRKTDNLFGFETNLGKAHIRLEIVCGFL